MTFTIHHLVKLNGLFFGLFLSCFCNAQTNYYLSTSGDDTNSGTSVSDAWKTISRLNSASLSPGDSVLFHRGERFTGQIDLTNSGTVANPIYFGAYNAGELPVISGAVSVPLASGSGSNLYEVTSAQKVKAFYVEDKKAILCREPNAGYYTIQSGTKSSITDNLNLNTSPDFYKGANVRFRSSNFTFEAKSISSSGSGSLNWSSNSFYAADNGYGYYLDNLPSFLDQDNEWYYDTISNKVLYFSNTSQIGRTAHLVLYDYGFNAYLRSNFVIENLRFEFQYLDGVYAYGTISNVEIRNCEFDEIERHGISLVGTYTDFNILNNDFSDVYGSGIMINNLNNSEVAGNHFNRIGMLQGYGGTFGFPINLNSGMYLRGSDLYVHHNITDSVGYNGIRVDGNNNLIEKNYIQNSVLTLNDGGGLYCWGDHTNNSVYRFNIIDNVVGNTEGGKGSNLIIANIYLDNGTNEVTVEENTGVRSTDMGMLSNRGNRRNTITNNTFYDFRAAGIVFPEWTADSSNINNVLDSNIFVGLFHDTYFNKKITDNSIDDYNPALQFDHNIYFNPFNPIGFGSSKTGGTDVHRDFTIEGWRNEIGSEPNSVQMFEDWYLNEPIDTTGANMINNGSFNTNISGWSRWTNGTAVQSFVPLSSLDAGAYKLEITSAGTNDKAFATNVITGDITVNQWYQLSFSITSSQSGFVSITPKRHYSPYTGIGLNRKFPFDTGRNDYKWVFQAPNNISAPARFDFEISESDGDFTLDNVELYPINVRYKEPRNKVKIYYNASDTMGRVHLYDTLHRFLDGRTTCADFDLEPWHSVVIINEEVPCLLSLEEDNESIEKELSRSELMLYPNPTKGNLNIYSEISIKEIEIRDMVGKIITHYSSEGENNLSINLEGIDSQMLLIKLFLENGRYVLKKIIVH